MNICLIILLLMSSDFTWSWDPDAGVVTSFTKLDGVTVQTTSGSDGHLIIDDDDSSHWTSANCLPSGFFSRPDINILFNACADGKCALSSSLDDVTKATDGDVYTVGHIRAVTDSTGSTQAMLVIQLDGSDVTQLLSINGIYPSPTTVTVVDGQGQRNSVAVLTSGSNYRDIQITDITAKASRIELSSPNAFSVKEIAAIGGNGCTESVTVDLTQEQTIGTIRTRHWAGTGSAFSVTLKVADDTGTNWHTVASLDPEALRPVTSQVDPPISARYIRLEYKMNLRKYVHIYCWEVDAWDPNGKWGPPVEANPQANSVRAILGVNGIWGWGHNKYSYLLKAGEGPDLYSPLASHARNYHNLNWDVTDPDESPNFVNMSAGHGTQAKTWLNWDKEYDAWRKAGLLIDTSIQFTNKTFPVNSWTDPEKAAFNYGFEFASHFGPAIGNSLVYAMEVGNEPWDYGAQFYATILKHMSAGVRSVDDTMLVLPGAFQAADKHDAGTYIGTRVTEDMAANISVINSHHYSFLTLESGVRTATYPEHRDSTFNELRNIIRWRNANTPSKPVWVTEWGWDAPHDTETCTFPECVTEKASALYAVRGLMLLTRSGIEKATWFFFANADYCSTLFCRSGLTASRNLNFAKTLVYKAFEKVLDLIGARYFLASLQETTDGYVYAFTDNPISSSARLGPQCIMELATHIVAWKPTDASDTTASTVTVEFPTGKQVGKVTSFTGDERGTEEMTSAVTQTGTLVTINVSARPIVVEIVAESGQLVG